MVSWSYAPPLMGVRYSAYSATAFPARRACPFGRSCVYCRMQESYLGIEIGGSKLPIVLGDESAVISRRWRSAVDPVRGGEGIREQIQRTLTEISSLATLRGIGVGFG